MKFNPWPLMPVAALVITLNVSPSLAASDPQKKVEKVVEVFEEIMSDPNSRIPRRILEQSEGIAIIPDVFKAGFFVGGTRGSGVMMVRDRDGSWSNPAFVSMTAGSLGLQFGAKSTDLVLVFKNRDIVNRFLSGSFKFGGNVSGTAGPIESAPVNSAKGFRDAPIYTYARSSGLYGGLSLEGSELGFDDKRNTAFYGQKVSPRQIFNDPFLQAPSITESVKDVLEQAEAGVLRKY
jgi:SH3 domain-containing YSC84-like protein 1